MSELWIDYQDLVSWGLSESYLSTALRRNRKGYPGWDHRPDPKDNRKKQVRYHSIPGSSRKKLPSLIEIRAIYQNRKEDNTAHQLRALCDAFVEAGDEVVYIRSGTPSGQAYGLVRSAAWLRLLASVRGKRDVLKMGISGIESKASLFNEALKAIQEERPHGLHRISNKRILQNKLKAWKDAQGDDERLLSLVHAHTRLKGQATGCQNARKVDDQAKRIIMSLWVNVGSDAKLTPEEIHASYLAMVDGGGVDQLTGEIFDGLAEISLSTVKRVIRSPEVRALGRFRHGDKWYKETIRPYVLGRLPSHAFTMTSSDGETCPFYLKDKRGVITWKRPTAYLIFDVYSEAIVGYALGMSEDLPLVRDAFYDLLVRNNRKRPLENQLDNFGKGAEASIAQVVETVSFCKPYNPQSKYAEPLIRAFERQVLKNVPGYIGTNITAKRIDGRRNPDLERIGYTFEEIDQIYREAIETFNGMIPKARKGKLTRSERLGNMSPGVKSMSLTTMAKTLGRSTEIQIDRGFIRLTFRGEEYVYQVPNYVSLLSELRSDEVVRVRFLPHDMSKVWLYNFSSQDPSNTDLDRFLTEAPEAQGTARAVADRKRGDGKSLRYYLGRGENMDKYTEETVAGLAQVVPLTPDEAEAVIGSGYTNKSLMKKAQEVVSQDDKKGINPRWKAL